MSETAAQESQNSPGSPAVEVQEVALSDAQPSAPKPANGQMDLLLDVTVKVQACLGEVERACTTCSR